MHTPTTKHHYVFGAAIIIIGSWITHTTTATVSEDFSNREAKAMAAAIPSYGDSLNGSSLPDELFNTALQASQGPLSEIQAFAHSPIPQLQLESIQPPGPQLTQSEYKIKRGDTLGSIFKKRKLDSTLAHNISRHTTANQMVSLSVGKSLMFRTDEQSQLRQVAYPLSALQELVVVIDEHQVEDAYVVDLQYQTLEKSISGEIKTSLYDAAIKAGLSINLVMEMVRIFGWDVDFVLDIREGDSFHVIYEQHQNEGNVLADGYILAAEFTTQNRTYRSVRFDDGQGNASYYTPKGESMLGTFLRSPVEFSRISSRFGKRKHPILKTWRAHKGVDYAASRGTPIRATADGKVVSAGRNGGYGKAVVLRHAGRFTTLYAHMNGFAKGIRSGNRVKQGDVIGYIGSTGLATGPHLHYEFRLNGVHRNPLTFKTPKSGSVEARLMPEFEHQSKIRFAQLDAISNAYQLAKAQSGNTSSEAF